MAALANAWAHAGTPLSAVEHFELRVARAWLGFWWALSPLILIACLGVAALMGKKRLSA
ncbi:MAG: hypothetical protein M3P27_03370 [Acidobacteriota bacterium]|nr:hypothetical protein [Acidobacteriota bacterium]